MINIFERNEINTIETIVLKGVHAEVSVKLDTLTCDRVPVAREIYTAIKRLCPSTMEVVEKDDDEYAVIKLGSFHSPKEEEDYFFELLTKEEDCVDTVVLLKRRTYTAFCV